MAQFARPDSNVTQSAFTGGFAEIDEAVASDADRAFSTDGSDAELEVGLSDVTDPQVGTGHIVRYRAGKTDDGVLSGTGNAKTLEVRLMQGATQIAADVSRTLTGAYQTFTWTLTSTQANAITDYTDLRLEFVSLGGGGNPTNRRGAAISWAELEVPDAPTIEQKTGSFAESQGHTAGTSGAKGALASWAESHGHEVTAGGTSRRAASFAESQGHTVEAVGSKTAEEEPEASGDFAVAQGHTVDAAGSKSVAGAFAAEASIELAFAGGRSVEDDWAVSQGHAVDAAGAKTRDSGAIAVEHEVDLAFTGSASMVGEFAITQGHSVDAAGSSVAPEEHSGSFTVLAGSTAEVAGFKAGMGEVAVTHDHAIALEGTGVRSGEFAVSHGHSVSASGVPVTAEERSGSWTVDHGITLAFAGDSIRASAYALDHGVELAFAGGAEAPPEPFYPRKIGPGPTRDVVGPGRPPPYAIPRSELW